MDSVVTRAELRETLLHHVFDAAADATPAIAHEFALGTSGVIVDLAIAADEFIGFIIFVGEETGEDLTRRLKVATRYLDRVVLATRLDLLGAAQRLDLAGAALWTLDDAGVVRAHADGRRNTVGPAALLDLMDPAERAPLLRSLVPVDSHYDRSNPPLGSIQIFTHVRSRITPPDPIYWSALHFV